MHVVLHTVLQLTLQCVCVCVCASVQCMYRVHNGLPLHKKSYGTQCICMYRRPFLYIPWTLHAAICTCTDQCAVKGGSIENHSYENSTCRRVAKGIQFHLHNVRTCIRVWESDLNAALLTTFTQASCEPIIPTIPRFQPSD